MMEAVLFPNMLWRNVSFQEKTGSDVVQLGKENRITDNIKAIFAIIHNIIRRLQYFSYNAREYNAFDSHHGYGHY